MVERSSAIPGAMWPSDIRNTRNRHYAATVLLDTGPLVALFGRNDAYHSRADQIRRLPSGDSDATQSQLRCLFHGFLIAGNDLFFLLGPHGSGTATRRLFCPNSSFGIIVYIEGYL
jgi:hypothetical protein